MRLKPNRSLLEARVDGLRRCADGYGAEIDLWVLRCEPMPPAEDFIGAPPDSALEAFSAVPEALHVGDTYCFEASVLGGPQGERVVLQRVRDAGPDPDGAAPAPDLRRR